MGVMKDIIERRVNTTGVSEPVVVVQGRTAWSSSCRACRTWMPCADWLARPDSSISSRSGRQQNITARSGAAGDQYPPLFSGDQITSAAVGQDQNNRLAVNFQLKNEGPESGGQLFAKYTSERVGDFSR